VITPSPPGDPRLRAALDALAEAVAEAVVERVLAREERAGP